VQTNARCIFEKPIIRASAPLDKRVLVLTWIPWAQLSLALPQQTVCRLQSCGRAQYQTLASQSDAVSPDLRQRLCRKCERLEAMSSLITCNQFELVRTAEHSRAICRLQVSQILDYQRTLIISISCHELSFDLSAEQKHCHQHWLELGTDRCSKTAMHLANTGRAGQRNSLVKVKQLPPKYNASCRNSNLDCIA
jgi:hypothetical protein